MSHSIAFEIDIKSKDSPNSNPAIKKKLELTCKDTEAAPSLADIQQKLERAEKARRDEQLKRKNISE